MPEPTLTNDEKALIASYKPFWESLVSGGRSPVTDAQCHFIRVHEAKAAAKTPHEIAYVKHALVVALERYNFFSPGHVVAKPSSSATPSSANQRDFRHDFYTANLKMKGLETELEAAKNEIRALKSRLEVDQASLRARNAKITALEAELERIRKYAPSCPDAVSTTITCPQCQGDGGAGGRCPRCGGNGTIHDAPNA